jgi:hypothetical protein
MTDPAPPSAPAGPMRIGLYVVVVVVAVVLVYVGIRVISDGSASGSTQPRATSSSSQTLSNGATTSTVASLPASAGTTPSPQVERTPFPFPETGADLAWERVATFGGAPNVFVLDLARGPSGYVAVGQRVDGVITELGNEGPMTPLVWRSADGVSWSTASVTGFDSGFPVSVTSDGDQYLAIIQHDPTTHIYRSVDGLAWHIIGDPPRASGGYIRKVLPVSSGFVAVGRVGGPTFHSAFWFSANGTEWTLSREETDNSEAMDITAGTKGIVAVGIAQVDIAKPITEAAWYSSDGITWLRRDPTPVGGGELQAVAATADGFFAAGWFADVGTVIWRSRDGMNWSPLPAVAALGPDYPGDTGSARAAFAFGASQYVTGYASCCGLPSQHTYVSVDGTLWARVHRDPAIAAVHLGTVTVEADRVVAAGNVLGSGGLGETGGIWIGRAP